MTNEQTNENGEARIRAWLAVMIIATVCAISALHLEVTEPLRGIALIVIGFYFGSHNQQD